MDAGDGQAVQRVNVLAAKLDQPEFDPQDPHGGIRELTRSSCHLSHVIPGTGWLGHTV